MSRTLRSVSAAAGMAEEGVERRPRQRVRLMVSLLAVVAVMTGCSRDRGSGAAAPGEQPDAATTPAGSPGADSVAGAAVDSARGVAAFPATWSGTIPCADCPGIELTVTLFGDHTFRLRQAYQDRDAVHRDEGTWSVEAGRLVLRGASTTLLQIFDGGSRAGGDSPSGSDAVSDADSASRTHSVSDTARLAVADSLRLLDGDGRPIPGRLPYALHPSDHVDLLEEAPGVSGEPSRPPATPNRAPGEPSRSAGDSRPAAAGTRPVTGDPSPVAAGSRPAAGEPPPVGPGAHRVRGMYVYLADAARFTDCATGVSYPVAMEGASASVERAYLEARSVPGEAVLAVLQASIAPRPAMEGGMEDAMVVDSLEALFPGMACGGEALDRPVEGTEWVLVRTAGSALPPPGARATLRFDRETMQALGSTGCGPYTGTYRLVGGELDISPTAVSATTCAAALKQLQSDFLESLRITGSYRVRGDTLELLGESGPVAWLSAAS